MVVVVDFVAPEGLAEGKREVELEVPEGSTITDLVRELVGRYGERARELLLQPDGVTPYVNFIVRGRIVPCNHVLESGDLVSVLPPIHGG